MNPRRWYTLICGIVLFVGGGLGIWYVLRNHRVVINENIDKAKGTARSVWGKVSNAASKLGHTEKDPTPVPIGFNR